MRIVVTGGCGKGGRWVVRDLREHGHEVVNVDLVPDGAPNYEFVLTDLTDAGQVHDVVRGADAIVHFAAIPAPGLRPDGETFRINTLSTWNVFQAAVGGRRRARGLGVQRDGPRAAVRPAAGLRPDRRDDHAAAGVVLRALEARRRDDGRAAQPPERHPVRRVPDLEHHGAAGLRPVPDLAGRRAGPEVEPLGLRRRAGRRDGLPSWPR